MVNDREFRTVESEVPAGPAAAPWHPVSGAPLDDIRSIADEEEEDDEEEDEEDEDDEDLDDDDLDDDEIEEDEEEDEPE